MMRAFLLAFILLASPALAQPSMQASAWSFEHSSGMPAHPVKYGIAGWRFVFPTVGDVDYLTTPATRLTGWKSITITGMIIAEPGAWFAGSDPHDTGTSPPSFHLYIQAAGDDCLCRDFGRWWTPVSVRLQNGSFTLTVPLAPSSWQSVFGHRGDMSPATRAGFAKALLRPARIGITFGAGNNFGHGVRSHGNVATFVVTRFHVD